jgi:hypothetical protein
LNWFKEQHVDGNQKVDNIQENQCVYSFVHLDLVFAAANIGNYLINILCLLPQNPTIFIRFPNIYFIENKIPL